MFRHTIFQSGIFGFALLLGFGTAPTTAQAATTMVSVCFKKQGTRVQGWISPIGCFSTSCIVADVRQGSVSVNSKTGRIVVTGRFDLHGNGNRVCTRDCGGGGRVRFDLGRFKQSRYEVTLNGVRVGTLDLSLAKAMTCFSRGK